MENMGTYFKDEQKKPRWESGQAILHKSNLETAMQQEDRKSYEVKNSYGRLKYLKKDEKNGQDKEGFTLEAFESPGTPVHTEKEKHIDRATMKKISSGNEKTLFASETPLRSQALFYEMPISKKSTAFLNCMKKIVHQRGHQTLHDAFGFLEQEPERQELGVQKERKTDLSPEEFEQKSNRINTLNSSLLRKEAKERQLCSELQIMLDQRTKEERSLTQRQEEGEKQQNPNGKKSHDSSRKMSTPLAPEAAEAATETETDET